MHYIPYTEADERRALERVGVASIEELFEDIPAELRDPEMDVAPGMNEFELLQHIRELAAKNRSSSPDFLGGGARRHFMPSVTSHLAM